jgi:hypothetical protein
VYPGPSSQTVYHRLAEALVGTGDASKGCSSRLFSCISQFVWQRRSDHIHDKDAAGEIASDLFPPFHADTPDGERFLQASSWSIPLFRADFLRFTSKIVEHSRYLPITYSIELKR